MESICLTKPDEAVFRFKGAWQKEKCFFCNNKATLQADYGNRSIRCCKRQSCMKRAAEFAKGERGE